MGIFEEIIYRTHLPEFVKAIFIYFGSAVFLWFSIILFLKNPNELLGETFKILGVALIGFAISFKLKWWKK